MSEPTYRVVWPLGKSTSQVAALKPRIADLAGKTVCHLSHGGFRDPEIRPIVEEVLAKRYPGIRFVEHTAFGDIHGLSRGAEAIRALPENLRKYGCDAVITGIGS
jgi:hypothetical protein